MNLVCASHPCPSINIKARLHTHPESPQTRQQLTYAEPEEDKRPSMCPELPSLRSHLTTLEVRGVFQRRGRRRNSSPDRFRHTGFLFQPQQRHMERPYFYQGRDQRRMKSRFSGLSQTRSDVDGDPKFRPPYFQVKAKQVLCALSEMGYTSVHFMTRFYRSSAT